ncbi:SDR family NAD(P)-dependent oxidoreductase [Streptomyces sp. NPDC048211]|uniref:SDR family NAD(P)-dependent oxidoreductase n=1 Tax=Streptomyces sp. NPDC048211 TaxID=3365516 RepID=UPI00371B5E6B
MERLHGAAKRNLCRENMRSQSSELRLADTPIAIVGIGSVFPNSSDMGDFWQRVVEAEDCIRDVPDSQWSTDRYFDPDPMARDKTYSRRGGFLPDVQFDAMGLGIPPTLLPSTDIVQLLSLVVARDLLRDAGTEGSSWYEPSRTGVVLGISGSLSATIPLSSRMQAPIVADAARSIGLSERDAGEIAERFTRAFVEWDEASFPGLLGNVVAGRIANRLNLGGMNCTVDAACASSLAAIEVAVRELAAGRQDMMVTGGCTVDNTVFAYMAFSKTPALSLSGNVRPFDESADGTLLGDGIGMLALRRLEDAERDGNKIYAVIRGLGTANDGRSGSIYAPQKKGQILALRRAYEDAGVPVSSVGLFEAHGTGTKTGDSVELSALTEFIRETTSEPKFAAIGSVKSQIGHTKAAAGAAGIIKTALALNQKILPPTINVTQPLGATAEEDSGIYVNVLARPWIYEPGRPIRRAAVSAFGFGGTNYHCVLEEYTTRGQRPSVLAPAVRTALWHAPDAGRLAERLAGHPPAADGAAIPAGDLRIGFVHRRQEEFEKLRASAERMVRERPEAETWSDPAGITGRRGALPGSAKVAALFAGQGSQYVNMGRTAALAVPPVREAFDSMAMYVSGRSAVSRAVFPPPTFGKGDQQQSELLQQTQNAQPAIGALSVGQYNWLRELGFSPDGFLGHSFGELTALWAAGVLTEKRFFKLAGARGRAMAAPATGDSGAMAALSAPRSTVDELVRAHPDTRICNINAPEQFVVGGATGQIEKLVAEAGAQGITASLLPVSAAFHTPFVEHAVDAFREAVGSTDFQAPDRPVYANTAGASYGADPARNKSVLVEQLRNPVDFSGRITEMYDAGFRVFVEFGPKSVLSGLVKRTLADKQVVCLSADKGPRADADRSLKLLALQLRVLGQPVDAISRYDRSVDTRPVTKGAVRLTAKNFVPEQKSAAYQQLLATPHVLTSAAAEASSESGPAAVPPGQDERVGVSLESDSGPATYDDGAEVSISTSQLLAKHVALSQGYLNGQLRVAQEMIADIAGQVSTAPAEDVRESLHLLQRYNSLILEGQEQGNHAITALLNGTDFSVPVPVPVPVPVTPPAAPVASPLSAVSPVRVPQQPTPERQPRPEPVAAVSAVAVAEAPVVVETPAVVEAPVVVETPAPAAVPAVVAPVVDSAAVVRAREALLAVVSEKTGYPVDMLDASMDIEADLGVDSIKRVEIVSGLQGMFPRIREMDTQRIGELRTLDDVVNVLIASDTEADGAEPESVAAVSAVAVVEAPVVVETPAPAAVPAVVAPVVDSAAVVRAREALLAVVSEKTGYPVDMLDASMDIEADLGVDSIKRVEIVSGLQGMFPRIREMDTQRIGELRTLDDVVNVLIASDTEADGAEPEPGGTEAVAEDEPGSGVGRLQVAYDTVGEVVTQGKAFAPRSAALLVDDGSAHTRGVVDELLSMGLRPHLVALPGVSPGAGSVPVTRLGSWDEAALAEAVEDVVRRAGRLDLCVQMAGGGVATVAHAVERLAHVVLLAKLTQEHLLATAGDERSGFVVITNLDGAAGLDGGSLPAGMLGGLTGLTKTLAVESPGLFCRSIDIAPGLDDETVRAIVNGELNDVDTALREVGRDGRRRTALTFAPAGVPAQASGRADGGSPNASDVFVITGGARGVTAECVAAFAAEYPCELVVLGRTALEGEPEWATGCEGAELKGRIIGRAKRSGAKVSLPEIERRYRTLLAQREIAANLARFRAGGARVTYHAVDILDAGAVKEALGPYQERISGVIHGAGLLADRLIVKKKAEEVTAVLATKLVGLDNVLTSLSAQRLKHIVLFSSVAGLFGNRGQADYAVANEALNRTVAALRREGRAERVLSINWGAWDGGMVTAELRKMFEDRGVVLIPQRVGAEMFAEQFSPGRSRDTIVMIGPTVGPAGLDPLMSTSVDGGSGTARRAGTAAVAGS